MLPQRTGVNILSKNYFNELLFSGFRFRKFVSKTIYLPLLNHLHCAYLNKINFKED